MSFLKRLFGAAPTDPAPTTALPTADPLAEARRAAALPDQRREPEAWAAAQQLLANALIEQAGQLQGNAAIGLYREAENLLGDAILTAGRDANDGFLASMINLRAYAAYWRAAQLSGDERGRALADAANRYSEAQKKIAPEDYEELWINIGFYRGAAFQALAALKGGEDALPWFDEAASTFEDIDVWYRRAKGRSHTIALFNRYAMLEQRGNASPPGEKRAHLEAARAALAECAANPEFAPQLTDLPTRLAALDEAIAKL